MNREIPPMLHAPHADDCPAVGGDGGMYRVLATVHPKWTPRPGVCNCGRFYPPKTREARHDAV
jgi:hypothetical protein